MTGFQILGEIKEVETIARGHGVYIRQYLQRTYGEGHWRKMKGVATVQEMVLYVRPRYTGLRRTAWAVRITRSRR
jgi:hypothetical protein